MKGILFKPESIQAIIEGRKTQTRRVIKPQPVHVEVCDGEAILYKDANREIPWRYQVSETVYIKEGFKRWCPDGDWLVRYKDGLVKETDVSGDPWLDDTFLIEPSKWKSPLFMPEWAARHFITITGVKAEKVQEITVDDCVSEGYPLGNMPDSLNLKQIEIAIAMRIGWYKDLWNSINPKYPWESNPWVFAYTLQLSGEREQL